MYDGIQGCFTFRQDNGANVHTDSDDPLQPCTAPSAFKASAHCTSRSLTGGRIPKSSSSPSPSSSSSSSSSSPNQSCSVTTTTFTSSSILPIPSSNTSFTNHGPRNQPVALALPPVHAPPTPPALFHDHQTCADFYALRVARARRATSDAKYAYDRSRWGGQRWERDMTAELLRRRVSEEAEVMATWRDDYAAVLC